MKTNRELSAAPEGFCPESEVPRQVPLFNRKKLGPAVSWTGGRALRIEEGRLSGWEFGVSISTELGEVSVRLHDGIREAGACLLLYSAAESVLRLADIRVRSDLQQGGIGSLLVKFGFHAALEAGHGGHCGVRFPPASEFGNPAAVLQRAGLHLILVRIGFTNDFSPAVALHKDNIAQVRFCPNPGTGPPAYRLHLHGAPGFMVVMLLDPEPPRLLPGDDWRHSFPAAPATYQLWAEEGRLLALTGDMVLRPDGVEEFLNHVADCEDDVRRYSSQLALPAT